MRLLFFAIIIMTGIGSWNTRRKPLFSRPQSENGIATPPLPLNAVVAQRGASWGIYQRKKRTNLRCGSRSERPASIADGIPFAAENGRTRAPFDSQVKIRSHKRPNAHIGRAKPAEVSTIINCARKSHRTEVFENEVAYLHSNSHKKAVLW